MQDLQTIIEEKQGVSIETLGKLDDLQKSDKHESLADFKNRKGLDSPKNVSELEMPKMVRQVAVDSNYKGVENYTPPEKIEVSPKLKLREDYINSIRLLCDSLEKPYPKALTRKSKSELKQMLVKLTEVGVKQTQMPTDIPPQNTGSLPEVLAPSSRDDYAVMMLYNLNKLMLNVSERLSDSYKNQIGFKFKDVVKNLESNEEQKQSLKEALMMVWLEYKDEIQPMMNPIYTLLLVNFTILTSSIEKKQKNEKKIIV